MERIEFSQFVGVNKSIPGYLLKQNELSDLSDMVYSSEGQYLTLRRRGGLELFSESTGDEKIRFLREITDESGSSFILALCGDKLKLFDLTEKIWRYTGIDFSGEEMPDVTSIGQGRYVIHFADSTPFLIGGQRFADRFNVAIEAPDISEVKSQYYANLGSLGSGRYKYCLVYETKEGEKSSPSEHYTHLLNDEGLSSGAGGMIVLSNLPVSLDKRVTKKAIYRTNALQNNDNHFLFYLRKVIENNVTKFEDGLDGSDDNLGVEMPVYLNFPVTTRCSLIHQDRLIFGNVSVRSINYFAPAKTDSESKNRFRVTDDIPSDTGPVGSAIYKYRIVFVDSDGIESSYLETKPYKTKDEECRKVTLAGLPSIGGGFIREGLKRRIYRTKRNGEIFYFLTDIEYEGSVLIGGDSTNDADLGVAMKEGVEVENKLCGVAFSDSGNYGTFRNESFLEILKEDNDEIVALVGVDTGFLIIKRNSIARVVTNRNLEAWKVIPLADGIGVESSTGVLRGNSGIYIANKRGLYLLQGSKITKLSGKIDEWFKPMSSAIQVVCDFTESKLLILCNGNNPGEDVIIVFDEITGGFSKWVMPRLFCLLPLQVAGCWNVLVGGDEYLRFFNLNSSEDFIQGSRHSISPTVTTATHSLSSDSKVMRIRNICLKGIFTGGAGVNVKILSGNGVELNRIELLNIAEGVRVISFPIERMEQGVNRFREFAINVSGASLKSLDSIIIEYKIENKKDRSIGYGE